MFSSVAMCNWLMFEKVRYFENLSSPYMVERTKQQHKINTMQNVAENLTESNLNIVLVLTKTLLIVYKAQSHELCGWSLLWRYTDNHMSGRPILNYLQACTRRCVWFSRRGFTGPMNCTKAQTPVLLRAKLRVARYCQGKLSVCLSVTLMYRDHIGWNSAKVILRLISLTVSLSAEPNTINLLQREHPKF